MLIKTELQFVIYMVQWEITLFYTKRVRLSLFICTEQYDKIKTVFSVFSSARVILANNVGFIYVY